MAIIDGTLIRFLLAGAANTLVGTALMFLLYNVFGASYWLSSACNYVAGGILSFFINKFFTFKNNRKSLAQAALFAVNVAVCYLIAYAGAERLVRLLLSLQDERVRGNVAMLCGMCLYTALNYIGQRFVVFADRLDESEEEG